jgi:hypothetical protein
MGVEVMRMTAKEVLVALLEEGIPPEGWGRWVWRGKEGDYAISSLVSENTLSPVTEEVLFWWGGVNTADVPYFPEGYVPVGLLPEEVETVEEVAAWLAGLPEDECSRVEEEARKVLAGVLLREVIQDLPKEAADEFLAAIWEMKYDYPEAAAALEEVC